jgi:hypothetical protein
MIAERRGRCPPLTLIGRSNTVRPDFSGDYRFNREASTLSPGGADRISGGRMHIDHREPHFRCEGRYDFADAGRFEFSFELVTDGRETHESKAGRTEVMTLQWDGDALVFRARNGGALTMRYELVDSGRCIRVSEQNRGMGHDQDNVFVFDRHRYENPY